VLIVGKKWFATEDKVRKEKGLVQKLLLIVKLRLAKKSLAESGRELRLCASGAAALAPNVTSSTFQEKHGPQRCQALRKAVEDGL